MRGTWARCVIARRVHGMSACANCHWADNQKRCEFYRPPATEPNVARPHRRRDPEAQQHKENLIANVKEIMTEVKTVMRGPMEEMVQFVRDAQTTFLDDHLDNDARVGRLRRQFSSPLPVHGLPNHLMNIQDRLEQICDRMNS